MRRRSVVAALVVAALVVAGVAVAHGVDGGKSARAVSGQFTATTASRVTSRTCSTAAGKTVVTTDGTYTGSSTGDADLTGPATLHARSTINTTDGVGVVTGTLKIDVASGHDSVAQFTTVYSGGQLAGLAVGHAHRPSSHLVANVSAGFTAAGGFTSGKIGGSTGGAAVELAPAGCRSTPAVRQRSDATGLVTAVSPTSITVAGLTCTVPPALQSKVATVAVNTRAEIHCELVNNVNTLTKLERKK